MPLVMSLRPGDDFFVDDARVVLAEIRGRHQFDLVVDKTTVAYVRTDLDLTDKAIQMYNSGQIPATTPTTAPTGSK